MQIGNYKVPEYRLETILNTTLKKIYNTVKTDTIQSKDLSKLLGYKYGTEQSLFKKINSMVAYGILDGRGIYSVTEFGENMLFPESKEIEQRLKTKAFFNVELWKKLYEKYGKDVPKDGLWVQLKNITEIDPASAKKLENRIYSWYSEDVILVDDQYVQNPQIESNNDQSESTTTLTSSSVQNIPMSRQRTQSNDRQTIYFDKYEISLPKGDLVKEWEKLKKYMEVKLEDYKYEEVQKMDNKEVYSDVNYAKCPRCGLEADNLDEIKKSFGFRVQNGKQIVQSWCIDCRKSSNILN